jgi:NAD(P)-dependent dehydrogenase (short-subunit alcohol dehydrogenase family)
MDPKVWFITGCSTGFGRAIAEAALAAGHRVIATARDIRSIADLEKEGHCHLLTLDVTEPESIPGVIRQAAEVWGRIDVLVNNAGYGLVGAVEEGSDAQIRRCMETNFFGPLHVVRAALPLLRAQRSGHIVNISAAAAISNYAGFGIYGAAKGALEMMSESLRLELSPLGIRVTLVQPGPFRTDFINRSLDRAEGPLADYERSSGKFLRFLESMNGRQPGDPSKAAAAILAAVASDTPPLRLVLGKYANDKVRKRSAEIERERAAWETIGLPTDYSPPAS